MPRIAFTWTHAIPVPTILVLLTMLASAQGPAVDPDYGKAVAAWRSKHEADYTREYVPLAGLFFLNEGVNSVGSAPGSVVRLPDRAPASIGQLVYRNGEVRFEPRSGSGVLLHGKPVTAPVTLREATATEPPDELTVGDIAIWVHASGARRAMRLRDPQGEQARSFKGYRWFPIDPRYRVVARFIRDPQAREIQVASLTGDDQTYTTEGMVEFTLLGQTVRMRPMTTRPGRFYFIFRDASSGRETYAAARFLYSDLREDGTTVLDFNQAYNPPCAFNPFTTCPLPPPENRLTIPILAGEMDYVHAGAQ